MIRLYFQPLTQLAGTNWAYSYANYNAAPMWRWGKKATHSTTDYYPVKRANLTPYVLNNYDEYIDLPSAEMDVDPAKQTQEFTDQLGTSSPIILTPESLGVHQVDNMIQVEADAPDWFAGTRFASTDINADVPSLSKLWVFNKTIEDNNYSPQGYVSVTVCPYKQSTGTYGYACPPFIVPYYIFGTDIIRVVWDNQDADTTHLRVYVATVEKSDYDINYVPWADHNRWRLTQNHRRLNVDIAVGGTGLGNSDTALFSNAEVAWDNTSNSLPPFAPTENAVGRMAANWFYRSTSTIPHVIVCNLETGLYYKGYLSAVSDIFMVGGGASSDKTYQFSVSLTEQGAFEPEFLSDPTDETYLTVFDRTAV